VVGIAIAMTTAAKTVALEYLSWQQLLGTLSMAIAAGIIFVVAAVGIKHLLTIMQKASKYC
jgi:hypothetical protein